MLYLILFVLDFDMMSLWEIKTLLHDVCNLKLKKKTKKKQVLPEYLDSKKEELELWIENKLSGAMICSRAVINSQWEKPSSLFLNLEKKNFLNKSIPEWIDQNGDIHTDMREIIKMQYNFYKDLFTAKEIIPIPDSKYDHLIKNLPKISDHQKDMMDSEITIEELVCNQTVKIK